MLLIRFGFENEKSWEGNKMILNTPCYILFYMNTYFSNTIYKITLNIVKDFFRSRNLCINKYLIKSKIFLQQFLIYVFISFQK